jgi:ParB family chromosome partitioning protein
LKSSAKKIELASVDDLFSTEESRQDEQLEKIQEIPLSELHPFKDHPFKVKDDDAMIETADSIKKYGVLVPAIARPLPDGGYELVAGHRRRRASELAGKETMPVIVRDLDDDAATIIMVDSNLQRENLLPSERAFAYKMKLEAIKHQGARTDLTSVQVEQKLSARDQVAKEAGERSGIQVMRYVRLTELIPELLDMVDEKKIAFNPAYELSFLKPDEQQMLVETMDYEQAIQNLLLEDLHQALLKLSPAERDFILSYYEMKIPNATCLAQRYGITRQAADKRLKKIEEKIKKLVAIF